jgi:hypothetical protein
MATSGEGLARFLDRLALWWRNQVAATRAVGELNRCPSAELLRTASDLGVTAQGLRRFAARGPLSARLFENMGKAYRVDLGSLRRTDFGMVREMEERCALCGSRLRCALDLSEYRQAAQARARAYCPNAEAFEALRRSRYEPVRPPAAPVAG